MFLARVFSSRFLCVCVFFWGGLWLLFMFSLFGAVVVFFVLVFFWGGASVHLFG